MRAIGVFTLCVLLCPPVFAMMCVRPEPAALIAKADYIFEATVQTRQKIDAPAPASAAASLCWTEGERCGPKIATMRVGRVWKGTPGKEVAIRSIDGCYCLGTYFFVGDRYIVFATRASGDGYDMDDMGACATELLASAEKRGFIQAVNALIARPD